MPTAGGAGPGGARLGGGEGWGLWGRREEPRGVLRWWGAAGDRAAAARC